MIKSWFCWCLQPRPNLTYAGPKQLIAKKNEIVHEASWKVTWRDCGSVRVPEATREACILQAPKTAERDLTNISSIASLVKHVSGNSGTRAGDTEGS